MTSNWRSISRCRAPEDLYPLLVRFETGTTGYSIYLTDLIHIWSEKLERKDIVRRALDLDASIDPSEGGDQLKLLLQNLQEAVDGRPHTSLSLNEAADDGLLLQVTASLPFPLPPLVWPFRLRSASPELFSYELVLPCLSNIVQTKNQVSSLLTQLKEKDQVISRLLDKLQSAGIELNIIFPNIPLQRIPKSNMREVVIKSVKGLSEFDEEKWRASLDASLEPRMHTEFICGQVFTGDTFGGPRVELPPSLRKWHARRGSTSVSHKPEKHLASPLSARRYSGSPLEVERNNDTSEDEFQKQSTPKKDQIVPKNTSKDEESLLIKAPTTNKAPKSPGSEVTTSGSDDDLEMQSRPAKPGTSLAIRTEPPATKPKKLGLVGGIQKQDTSATLPTKTPLEDNLAPPSKLGMIGGKLRQPRNNEKVVKSPLQTNGTTSSTNVADSSMAGIGSPPSVDAPERAGRSREISPSVLAHTRETSEERADKKRAQLKRDLEEKSKLQVKKKRKF